MVTEQQQQQVKYACDSVALFLAKTAIHGEQEYIKVVIENAAICFMKASFSAQINAAKQLPFEPVLLWIRGYAFVGFREGRVPIFL